MFINERVVGYFICMNGLDFKITFLPLHNQLAIINNVLQTSKLDISVVIQCLYGHCLQIKMMIFEDCITYFLLS
jgi:hypothetical protein